VTNSRAQRLRAKRGYRGATVFVVILVIAMLTGIGLFAAQAATIATTTSGSSRISTQSRYFAETAMTAAIAKISSDLAGQVSAFAKTNSKECLGQSPDPFYPQCTRYGLKYLESELGDGFRLFVPGEETTTKHGTLGRVKTTTADMLVEMNDLYRVERPIAGFDYTSAGAVNVHFMSLMLHGTGRVRIGPTSQTSTTLSSTTLRAEIIVGPITGP